MALSSEQIEAIRAWIGAGAPHGHRDAGMTDDASDASVDDTADAEDVSGDAALDTPADSDDDADDGDPMDANGERNDDVTNEVGPETTDVRPPMDADPCFEAGAPNSIRSLRPSRLNQIDCTATKPCPPGMSCMGNGCDDVWECFAHGELPGQHPCPDDYAPYCGCDGVTFMAIRTCPDRPYQREGACEDGVSCDPSALRCTGAAPSCPEGQVPSVVDGRYGQCVAFGFCRCASDEQCPQREKYKCDTVTSRCQLLPIDP